MSEESRAPIRWNINAERIAAALERIATALEAANAADPLQMIANAMATEESRPDRMTAPSTSITRDPHDIPLQPDDWRLR